MRLTAKQVTWLKVCLHLAGLLPFLWLAWAINHGGLGADPVKDIQHFTGRTALKIFAGDLVNHTSGTLRKTAVIDTHSPPVRLMVLCLGDTAFNQLRIAGAGRE